MRRTITRMRHASAARRGSIGAWQALALVAALTACAVAAGDGVALAAAARRVDRAADDFNMAAWLYASKKYEMAAEEFRNFIRNHSEHPKVPEARLTLGRALVRLKKYEEAVKAFETVREESPG
jgi:tetratricopeptide (TPR) repeat protein